MIRFLAAGLLGTLRAAILAMALALVAGVVLVFARLSRRRLLRAAAIGYLETFRGLPVLLLIFASFLAVPRLGFNISRLQAVVLALALYNSAVLGEIFRAGILSLERGQREGALALGLTEGQAMRSVVLPQAVRRMLPAIVSQLVTLLKDTSLGSVIGYEELLRRSDLAAKTARPASDLQAFLIAGAIYVLVNLLLSRLARRLESAQRRRYGVGAIVVTGVPELTVLSVTGADADDPAGRGVLPPG